LIVIGLHGRKAVGGVAQLRLRGANLFFEQLGLLARLGQKGLEVLIIAVERGGSLLILLGLLSQRGLLLRRQRHRRLSLLRVWRKGRAIAAG
jgi:hypothetical protein